MSCALDSNGQLSLMTGAGAGYTAGKDLGTLGDISLKLCNILIVDLGVLSVNTERANLLSALSEVADRSLAALGALGSLSLRSLGLNFRLRLNCNVFNVFHLT